MPSTQDKSQNGNISDVVIKSDTVIRDLKPQSHTIHRLLKHLKNKGLNFVPRFLGLVDDTHERLSFVAGETAEDYPLSDDLEKQTQTVKAAAKMLRTFHDATLDFQQTSDDIWFLSYDGPLEKQVICHNDFAPYNVTFDKGLPVGIIDFDTACPAPRIWDIAYALYRFIPLGRETFCVSANTYRPYDKNADQQTRRCLIDTFLDAYGFPDKTSALQHIPLRLQSLVDLFDAQCRAGDTAFIRMRDEGHQQLYKDEIAFINQNMNDWR
ncbi:MAG: aminoglycoside phosphotransferase family protein [Eubacteriales bacterium]